jgi:hypothetical protein
MACMPVDSRSCLLQSLCMMLQGHHRIRWTLLGIYLYAAKHDNQHARIRKRIDDHHPSSFISMNRRMPRSDHASGFLAKHTICVYLCVYVYIDARMYVCVCMHACMHVCMHDHLIGSWPRHIWSLLQSTLEEELALLIRF